MPKIILTNHARERMLVRRVNQAMIEQTVSQPQGRKKEDDGDTQFHCTLKGRKVHVVAKPLERGEWLIKTVWVDGEDDPNPLIKLLLTLSMRLWQRLRK